MCYNLIFAKKANRLVPCGKCARCYMARINDWQFRLLQEDKHAITSYFITLTYDTRSVPIGKTGKMVLSPRDLQLFFKRLRKSHVRKYGRDYFKARPIRYYAVGEYGGRTRRPHYHVLCYNVDAELVQDAWALGSIDIGTHTANSVGYTMKYMCKWNSGKGDRGLVSEFSRMSKGLGESYLTPQMIQWHLNDINRMYCVLPGGVKMRMPRYYRLKIYKDFDQDCISAMNQAKIDKHVAEVKRIHGIAYEKMLREAGDVALRKLFGKKLKTQIL